MPVNKHDKTTKSCDENYFCFKQAADSLAISSVSVDAHIGGIYQKPTSPMIAANSFHINCKMEPPVHRLKLPEISDKCK